MSVPHFLFMNLQCSMLLLVHVLLWKSFCHFLLPLFSVSQFLPPIVAFDTCSCFILSTYICFSYLVMVGFGFFFLALMTFCKFFTCFYVSSHVYVLSLILTFFSCIRNGEQGQGKSFYEAI